MDTLHWLLPCGIAALALLLVLVQFRNMLESFGDLHLARIRRQRTAFADKLPYHRLLEPDTVLCKSGALMAAWVYQAPDDADRSPAQRNALKRAVNAACLMLDDGWMLQWDLVRFQAPGYAPAENSVFPDAVSAAIDEERRQYFESLGTLYRSFLVVTATYMPPLRAARSLDEFAVGARPERAASIGPLAAAYKRAIELFEADLRASGVVPERLARPSAHRDADPEEDEVHNELLRWLNLAATGEDHVLREPPPGAMLDPVLGNRTLYTRPHPRIGKKFIQAVTVAGFPVGASVPGILHELTELPAEYRWSTRFIFLGEKAATDAYAKFSDQWGQQIRGDDGSSDDPEKPVQRLDRHAEKMSNQAEVAIEGLKGREYKAGFYTCTVIILDEDLPRSLQAAEEIRLAINAAGYAARVEDDNIVEAYLGSLPGNGFHNVRRPILTTKNLAASIPASSPWPGEEFCPCPFYPPQSPAFMQCLSTGWTPFWLNTHYEDLPHALFFGPAGSGKSFHLVLLAAQMLRIPNMRIFYFDNGGSAYALCAAINAATGGRSGQYYAPGGDSPGLYFCPFKYMATAEDRAFLADWMETTLILAGLTIHPDRRSRIEDTLEIMHGTGQRTLSDFSTQIQDPEVQEALRPYCRGGLMGSLLDGDDDLLEISNFTVIDLEPLLKLAEKFSVPVLLYLLRRFESGLVGQPAGLIFDEAWKSFTIPLLRSKLETYLRVLRRANCAVILATQSAADANRSGMKDILLDQCKVKIFLANDSVTDDALALYKEMELSDHQVAIIKNAQPKRDYYYTSPAGCRLYQLAAGPLARLLAGNSDRKSIRMIRERVEAQGHGWLEPWLREHGISLQDYATETSPPLDASEAA